MALAYLLDPCLQHQNRAGVNNVSGYFEVFEYDTDDRATVYTDFEGTLAPAHIGIDNNGRCVMIADSSKAYRVEMHLPNGDLVYTQAPVWTVVSGGGVVSNKVEVESTDGSIAVDKTVVGNVTTYDLSANVEDGTDLLEWIRCDGGTAQAGSDIVKPTYSAGTMLVGSTGVQVKANSYYHVTAHLRATKSDVDAYYDNVYVLFSLGNEPVTRQSVIIDYSMGLSQDFEVSTDVKADADSELNLSIIGASNAGDVELLNMEMHRIYSGTPVIPGGVQRTLIAGANITIEHTGAGDVISSTGGGGGTTEYTAGEGIDITGDVISVDQSVIQHKLIAGDNITINNVTNTISADVSGKADKVDGATNGHLAGLDSTGNLTDSGIAASDVATQSDLNGKQDTLTTGPNIDIINNVISTEKTVVAAGQNVSVTSSLDNVTRTRTYTVNASGAAQVQSDWTQSDNTQVDYIKHKPTTKPVVAGSNITITETSENFTISAASTPEVIIGTVVVS